MQKFFFLSLLSLLFTFSSLHADITLMQKQAFMAAKLKADQGDANAQFSLGGMYFQGITATKNYAKAIEWFTKAARQGHVKAKYNLGHIYYHGNGTPVDYEKAYLWFEDAAADSDTKAQLFLARMNYVGQGTEQNYTKAFAWYKKVADTTNDPKAQQMVGRMYLRGLGIAQDREKARHYLNKSSEQSCADAQYELGKMYLSEGQKGKAEAKRLMQEAYLNGSAEAKKVLDEHQWEPIKDTKAMPSE